MKIKLSLLKLNFLLGGFTFFLFSTITIASELPKLSQFPVYKKVLDNGLVCLVMERPGSGLVAINIGVNTGSANEGEFLGTGITHLIEHMVFKSTEKYRPGQIEKAVKSIGGQMNATTSKDLTSFFITVPYENFPQALEILKEILSKANFPEDELAKEKQVILKEMILHQDNPSRKLLNLLWKTIYQVHPYQHPVIGYRELFKRLKREDIVKYYQTKFVPNNMVVSIVGDIKKEEAFKLIEKHFSSQRYPSYSLLTLPQEPPQISTRYTTEAGDINLARIALGFPSTELVHKDLYALDLLAVILGQKDTSRLHKKLVEQLQLVRSVSAFNYTPKYKGAFVIEAVLKPENIPRAKKIILQELELLKKHLPTKEEVERAKSLLISEYIHSHQTVQQLASSLTINQILTGDYNFYKKYIEGIKKVTPNQIREVAKKYLKKETLNFVQLLPRNYTQPHPQKPPQFIFPALSATRYTILDNGIKVVAIKNSSTPSISITAAFLGGVRGETPLNNGISNITAQMLLKGTRSKSESEIKLALEKRGGSIDYFSGENSFGITIDILKDDLDFALEVLKDIILHPAFSEEKLEKVKYLTLLDIQLENDDIFSLGINQLKKLLYKNHPYALPEKGSKESIRRINRDKVINFYRKFAVTSNMVISLSGDFDPKVVIEKVRHLFNKINPSSNEEILNHKPVLSLSSIEKKNVKMKRKQALILLGFTGTTFDSKDRFALDIISSIMSGSSGRLFQTIRNKGAVSYTQNFFHNPEYDKGFFGIYVATSPQNTEKATKTILEQLQKLVDEGVTDEEIEQAKIELIANHRMQMQSNSFVSLQSALNELYGIGFSEIFNYESKIRKVSIKDIENIIEKYIKNNPYIIVTVTPPQDKD